MDRLSHFSSSLLAAALVAVSIFSASAQNADRAPYGTAVASATPVDVCGAHASLMSSGTMLCPRSERADPKKLLAGVTCAANEWCCKHDIGGTNECTKCCRK
jgi:hypothetical protein